MKTGDIKIYFHSGDLEKHRNHLDPNFFNLVLQVCIFSNSCRSIPNASNMGKRSVPILFLLPHLFYGLEEYAEALVLTKLAGRALLTTTCLDKLRTLTKFQVNQQILQRWEAKVRFAQVRLSKLKWSTACHQWFLEVLGYSGNRSPMLRIANQFPFGQWKQGKIDSARVYDSESNWNLRGCRPANHPRKRIVQYEDLWKINPDWIKNLRDISVSLQSQKPLQTDRKTILALANYWKSVVMRDVFSKSQANTLWIDFALPILCANFGINGYNLWEKWPAGNCPQKIRQLARHLGWTDGTVRKPLSNGMVQCIIGFSYY